jgi:hypothetical protein
LGEKQVLVIIALVIASSGNEERSGASIAAEPLPRFVFATFSSTSLLSDSLG